MAFLGSLSARTFNGVLKVVDIGTQWSLAFTRKAHEKIRINYPPTFVLHDLLGSKQDWAAVSKKIADDTGKTVIAVDARNHGEAHHDKRHSYFDLSSDVTMLMDKLRVGEASIIGHCMGGMTGMLLALVEPAKVKSLVVVDVSPLSSERVWADFFYLKLMDVIKNIKFEEVEDVEMARGIAKYKLDGISINSSDYESMKLAILNNIGRRKDNKIGWLYNIDALKNHFSTMAKFPIGLCEAQYLGPTLFIASERSCYVPSDDFYGIQCLFPYAQLVYVADVGHNVQVEDPNTFISLVIPFLNAINHSETCSKL